MSALYSQLSALEMGPVCKNDKDNHKYIDLNHYQALPARQKWLVPAHLDVAREAF